MVTTWKSSLRDSIYNLYIAEPRTSKNKGKKKNQRQREKCESSGLDLGLACAWPGSRERPRPRIVRDPSCNSGRVARCLGKIWVVRETQAAHRVRPAAWLRPRRALTGCNLSRAAGRTREPVRDLSRVAWARPRPRPGNGRPRLFPIRSKSESLSLLFFENLACTKDFDLNLIY